jgi:hypothetical protein
MAGSSYIAGRRKYQRPQAMLWADNPGTLTNGIYVPLGAEIGADTGSVIPENKFIILSDDNRSPIDFSITRLENRERMINGRMRSYHIADKLSVSTSWSMLPSRSFIGDPNFNENTGKSPLSSLESYTSDGGAGGAELLDWYQNNTGSFWVYLAYDKYTNFPESGKYDHLQQYNQIVEMFISSFTYSVVKRGGSNFDFWDISVTLEEV